MFWTAYSLEFLLHFPESVVHLMNGRISDVWLTGIVFPGIILALAILDPWLSSLCRPIAFLGDISYSLYLLHFPMQLVFAAAVDQIWMDHSLFYSPYFMMLYFSCLILTSIVTFHFFEMPLQRSLRQITRI
jgi:peptidoglycan/LPS O-acetylase OafA/YrhL